MTETRANDSAVIARGFMRLLQVMREDAGITLILATVLLCDVFAVVVLLAK